MSRYRREGQSFSSEWRMENVRWEHLLFLSKQSTYSYNRMNHFDGRMREIVWSTGIVDYKFQSNSSVDEWGKVEYDWHCKQDEPNGIYPFRELCPRSEDCNSRISIDCIQSYRSNDLSQQCIDQSMGTYGGGEWIVHWRQEKKFTREDQLCNRNAIWYSRELVQWWEWRVENDFDYYNRELLVHSTQWETWENVWE